MEKNWRFDLSRNAAFEMSGREQAVPWEFIYQNRDILVRVDQNGVNNCQAAPPRDIMLFKREWNEKFSKWLVWIRGDSVNGGKPVCNFRVPTSDVWGEEPVDTKINYLPEKAVYEYVYKNLTVTTELLVPLAGSTVVMRTTLKNTSGKACFFEVTPCLMPYVNQAVLAPWDKPEWYLATDVDMKEGKLNFTTALLSPSGDKSARRLVTMRLDGDCSSCESSLERFCGSGDFNCPKGALSPELGLKAGVGMKATRMCGYPPVYAAKYKINLKPDCAQTFTQVLCMQSQDNREGSKNYFDEKTFTDESRKIQQFYDRLFALRTVKTHDTLFDHYVNTFLPLQMYWVASLDRGWPTGMRGVRDCSNDFMGMLALDDKWARNMLLGLLQCQRSDGWFPRQVSAGGKNGKHDMRKYVDGGAFFLEFFYEYMCFTGDGALLCERVSWLDDDRQSTVLVHALKALDFYLAGENIGEHGLVKIYEGDWLDAVNRAGVKGRGESVTVTGQVIMSLENMQKVLSFAVREGIGLDVGTDELCRTYRQAAEKFKRSLTNHAYNKKGFFSSVFTDGGKWVFSDNDEDGACRFYGPANYYAIISGAADEKMTESILEKAERLKCDMGYRLFDPPFGEREIASVGRIAGGDVMQGLWENGSVYNHGSNGFLARALACVGESKKLFDVIEYMLPYSQQKHPTEVTLSAPYAVVNCYQGIECFKFRAGMPFLTGTTAMTMRAVYNWMFGLDFRLDGIAFKPCLTETFSGSQVNFSFRGCKFHAEYRKAAAAGVIFNGKRADGNFIGCDSFSDENQVTVLYT